MITYMNSWFLWSNVVVNVIYHSDMDLQWLLKRYLFLLNLNMWLPFQNTWATTNTSKNEPYTKRSPLEWLQAGLYFFLLFWLKQPIWKICSSNWIISPSREKNKRYLSCHHPVLIFFLDSTPHLISRLFFPRDKEARSGTPKGWTASRPKKVTVLEHKINTKHDQLYLESNEFGS